MRFLVDNALSPVLATLLSQAGHDALHVRTIELQRAEDIVIFDRAAAEDRILVSADTDFGALLAARHVKKPSVIQFRGPGSRKPEALSRTILKEPPSPWETLNPHRQKGRRLLPPINRGSELR